MAFSTEFVLGTGGATMTRVPVNVSFPDWDSRNLTTVSLAARSFLGGYVEATDSLMVGPVDGAQVLYSTRPGSFGAVLNAGTYTIAAFPLNNPGITATAVNWIAIPI